MLARRWPHALLAAALAVAALSGPAEAQSWKDRLRGATKRTTDAVKKTATDEARREMDGLLGEVVAEVVPDGRFAAVLTPWTTDDGAARAEYARIAGSAVVVTSGGTQTLLLCDDGGTRAWSSSFTVHDARAAGVAGSRADGQAAPARLVAAGDHALPSDRVTVAVMDAGARAGAEAKGSLRVASVSDDVWVGTAKLTLASVALPGAASAEAVEFAATFRAVPLRADDTRQSCVGRRAEGRR